jgi:hypothetical protein
MKLFGRHIRYSPKKTEAARLLALMAGDDIRGAVKFRAYAVSAAHGGPKEYRVVYGFFGAFKLYLGLGRLPLRAKGVSVENKKPLRREGPAD